MNGNELMINRFLIVTFLFVVVSQISVEQIRAGDWPQILGPNRNGLAVDERLADKWPDGKPQKAWEASVGSGFAGAAVSDNQLVLFHREKANDKLTAFNAETGKPVWTTNFPSTFRPQIVDDDGPRAVPTIQDGAVYAYSAEGRLYCVDVKTGKKRWERKTHEDFGADGGYFGAGSAPLVDGKHVIVNVGGNKKVAGIVAFDADSGDTVWTAVNDQASYSAPLITTIDDTRHLLCITRLNLVSLDPETGKERFRTPFGQRGPTVNGAIPVVAGSHALLTASYGIGAEWISITKNSVDVVWSDEVLSSQYTTPILQDGAMYGIDGRQDGGPITLKCFDPRTRKVHWTESWPEYATLIGADGKLLVMQTDGKLSLVRMSSSGYEQLGSASLLSGKTRALPALANGRLYIRNEKTLACFNLFH
jgi:outer membrane protein assembly factor BamB